MAIGPGSYFTRFLTVPVPLVGKGRKATVCSTAARLNIRNGIAEPESLQNLKKSFKLKTKEVLCSRFA